jgi:hypothetical protein
MGIMEILTMLQQNGILNIAVVILSCGVMTKIRPVFLDKLIEKIKYSWLKWLILTFTAFLIASFLTVLSQVNNFKWYDCLKMSTYNWLASWLFYDAIKNLFFSKKE